MKLSAAHGKRSPPQSQARGSKGENDQAPLTRNLDASALRIPCYDCAMMKSEVGIVNGEMKNTAECWSAGVVGRLSNLATHPSTPRPNQAQSRLIKPNRGILCLDVSQSQPPSCSRIATSPIRLRQNPAWRASLSRRLVARKPCEGGSDAKPGQTPSNPVKASQSVFESFPSRQCSSRHRYILWFPRPNTNPLCFAACDLHQYCHAIRNSRQTQSNPVKPIRNPPCPPSCPPAMRRREL